MLLIGLLAFPFWLCYKIIDAIMDDGYMIAFSVISIAGVIFSIVKIGPLAFIVLPMCGFFITPLAFIADKIITILGTVLKFILYPGYYLFSTSIHSSQKRRRPTMEEWWKGVFFKFQNRKQASQQASQKTSQQTIQTPPQSELEKALEVFGFASIKEVNEQELKKRYRSLARTYHPDSTESEWSEAMMRKINASYTYLKKMC